MIQYFMRMKIGFIGQGWIGKNYADNFEKRGFAVVRYSLEEPHVKNGDKIGECNREDKNKTRNDDENEINDTEDDDTNETDDDTEDNLNNIAYAKSFCKENNNNITVYSCGEYVQVSDSEMIGSTTYYKKNMSGINCPVVSPDYVTEKCKELYNLSCEKIQC